MTVQFYSFRPSIFCRWGRPLRFFKTVQFHSFGPSSFNLLDRPVFALGTVLFDSLRPSSFIPLDRPLLSLETVQIQYFNTDRTVISLWTVHFWISGPSTLADRPL